MKQNLDLASPERRRGLIGGMVTAGGVALVANALSRPAEAQPATQPLTRFELAGSGVFFEVTRLARVRGQPIVEMRFNLIHQGERTTSLQELGMSNSTDAGQIGRVHLLDLGNNTAYELGWAGRTLSSTLRNNGRLTAGERHDNLWCWFGAPPANITRLAVAVPGAPPAIDVPLS